MTAAETPVAEAAAHRERWVTSQDGLRLFLRDYGPANGPLTAVLCLPGLTRSSRDFDALARQVSGRRRHRRRVLALEMRGRGRSQHDRSAAGYTVQREALDALDVITALGLERVIVVGTSRGGLNAMVMAAIRPAALAGVILNDVGPRIEGQGLMRIVSQLRRMPRPRTWEEATQLMRQMHHEAFSDLDDDGWERFTRNVFRDDDGRPRPDFDPGVVRSLSVDDIADGQLPELWPQFEALSICPVLCIRGANSDVLSAATVEEMAERHPDFACVTVPARGHAPFLDEPSAVEAINAFLDRLERKG